MGICSLLAEIYGLEGIKTGLKFEVELLFKSLGLQVGAGEAGGNCLAGMVCVCVGWGGRWGGGGGKGGGGAGTVHTLG